MKYKVNYTRVREYSTTIEADSEEDAEDKIFNSRIADPEPDDEYINEISVEKCCIPNGDFIEQHLLHRNLYLYLSEKLSHILLKEQYVNQSTNLSLNDIESIIVESYKEMDSHIEEILEDKLNNMLEYNYAIEEETKNDKD